MMTVTEHLLFCLSEECSEVAKEACKAGRFGMDDCNPLIENDPPQREHIRQELCDLLGVMEMVIDAGLIENPRYDRERINAKKDKVLKYMDYARRSSALQ